MPWNPSTLHGINVFPFRFTENPNAYEALSNARKPRVYVTPETNIVVFLKLIPSGYVSVKHVWDWVSDAALPVYHRPDHVTIRRAAMCCLKRESRF